MRIAYFINHYPKVSHTFIRREIHALERQGFEIQRIALHGWNEPLPDLADQVEREKTQYVLKHGAWPLVLPAIARLIQAPVRFLRALGLAFKLARDSDRSLPYHLVYLAEACRVLAWVSQTGATRIHAHFGSNSAEVALLTEALGGPPYSFTIHGPGEFNVPISLGEKVHRSAFTVAISNFGASQIFMRTRYSDWSKVKVVRCGLERSFYDGQWQEFGEPRRFICVGRLCVEKGQLLLVEAVARLRARGIPVELVLAGDGPSRVEIEALVRRHALEDAVRITGWISSAEVRSEILAARALVLPSFAEGLPVVIMEAMALHRPVLSTYVAGIPELIQQGENGWLFAAGSVDALVDAMNDCLSLSREELARRGASAFARVVELHDIDNEAAKLASLLREGPAPSE